MNLAILVPVLRRPQNVAPLMASIREATPDARVLFICDPGDRKEISAIKAQDAEFIAPGGNYAAKINAGIEHTTEDAIFTGADDLRFTPGWFEAAAELIRGGVGVAGTVDNCNDRTADGTHSTHSLVARWYCELGQIDGEPGLLHEGYPHEFVDDELVAVAKHRGAYEHCFDAVVEHLHPMNGRAAMDALYAGQRRRMRVGRQIFEGRRHLWM